MNNEAAKIQADLNKIIGVVNQFPTIAGVEAVNFYTQNFRKQGFDDEGVSPWVKRKRDRPRDLGRALLVKTGRLRRSIMSRKAGKLAVWIISNLPYATRQNEGGGGIAKRQFVGDSRKLNRIILEKINKLIQRSVS